jgi:hypothetical protein
MSEEFAVSPPAATIRGHANLRHGQRRGPFQLLVSANNGCLPIPLWNIDAIRRVNGDAMEAAGLPREYFDEMVSRLRAYASTA